MNFLNSVECSVVDRPRCIALTAHWNTGLNTFPRFPRTRAPKKMDTMHIRWKSSLGHVSRLLFLWAWASLRAMGQCAAIATAPTAAADCAAHAVAQDNVAIIDPGHPYALA